MENLLTYDDVKQYLIEGDVASEAEEILLKSLKQDEIRNRKNATEKELQKLSINENETINHNLQFRPNVLKIADLLDSFDEPMVQRVPRPKETDSNSVNLGGDKVAFDPKDFDPTTAKSTADIDKMLEDELFKLEEMKLAIQRKAQDEKLRMERQKKLADIEFEKNHPKFSQPAVHSELDIQKKLLLMAEERVLRSAAQRAEIEQKTRELHAIEERSIPFQQLPTFQNILSSKGSSAPKQEQSFSAPKEIKDDFRNKRVQHILSEIQNPEQLAEKRTKIEQLRIESTKPTVDILEELLKQKPVASSNLSVSSPNTSRTNQPKVLHSQDTQSIPSEVMQAETNGTSSKSLRSAPIASAHGRSGQDIGNTSKIEAEPVIPRISSNSPSRNSLVDSSHAPYQQLKQSAPSYPSATNANNYNQHHNYPSWLFPQQQQPQMPISSPPLGMNPWQQQQLQQMQQLEMENMKLQQQMMLGMAPNALPGGNPNFMMMAQPRDYLVGGLDNNNFSAIANAPSLANQLFPFDPAFAPMAEASPFPFNNGSNANNTAGLSREEKLRREEIRRIEFEMEKLKKSTELQEFRQQLEQRQRQQREEEEHARWLEQQKRELQRLKMEQVLQKEKRLLELAQQPLPGMPGNNNNVPGNLHPMVENDNNRVTALREACGVAGGIENTGAMSLSMVNGMAVIVDGFMFTVKANHSNNPSLHPFANLLCRVALGIYDRQGRSVVRLAASDWASFVITPENNAALVDTAVVQALQPSLLRNLAVEWETPTADNNNNNNNSNNSSSSSKDVSSGTGQALQIDYHRNKGLRAVVELQVKTTGTMNTGEVRPLGWCVVPLTRLSRVASSDNDNNNNNVNTTMAVLNRDCHRLALRQGLPDPAVVLDDFTGVSVAGRSNNGSGTSLLAGNNSTGNMDMNNSQILLVDPSVSILLRIVEKKDFGRAAAWQLAQQTDLNSADVSALYSPAARLTSASLNRDARGLYTPLLSSSSSSASSRPVNVPPVDRGSVASPQIPSLTSSRTSLHSSQSGKLMTSPLSSRPVTVNQDPSGGVNTPFASQEGLSGNSNVNSRSGLLVPNRLPAVLEEDVSSPAPVAARPAASLLSSAVTHAAKERERDRFWMLGAPLPPATDRYQRGDGLDIYVDAARFLPDNVTLTRVSMRIFSSNKEQIGPVYEAVCDPHSPAMFPRFHLKAELRASGGNGSLNATATALIRLDALDSCNLLPVSLGYACCKLFCTSPDRLQQPKAASEPGIFLNKGSFQLRLKAGRIAPSLERFSETMLSDLTVIPCASVLVRILPAPKSADGISTLSRDEIPREKWASLGLMVAAPRYDIGGYCGMYAEPSAQEWLAFEAKAKTLNNALLSSPSASAASPAGASSGLSVGGSGSVNGGSGWEDTPSAETELLRAMSIIPTHNLPASPPGLPTTTHHPLAGVLDTTVLRNKGGSVPVESAIDAANPFMRWWKSLLPAPDQMKRTLDYSLLLPYSVDAGVNLEIVGFNKLPADRIFPQVHQPPKGLLSGLFAPSITPGNNPSLYLPQVLTSLSPPALLYAEPPLLDGVQASRLWDVLRPMNVPRCLDGYLSFSPADMSSRLFLVVDVRFVEVTLPPPVTTNKSKTVANAATATKEVFKAAGRVRQYWTMVPLARERSTGLGHAYVLSGFLAAPLFEGAVPTDGLLTSTNPYKELVSRLQQGLQEQKNEKDKGNKKAAAASVASSRGSNTNTLSTGSPSRAIRLSDGVSLLLRVVNPLLRDLVDASLGKSHVPVTIETSSASSSSSAAASTSGDVSADVTFLRSLLTDAGADSETRDAFLSLVNDRDVAQAMDQWKNNTRDASLLPKDAAVRVAMSQLVPKLPGVANGSSNAVLVAQAVVNSAYEYFVQDIGLVKK